MRSESLSTADTPIESYRALSTAAVASLVLGLASFVTMLSAATSLMACLVTLPIPLLGLLLGWRGLLTTRKMPEEFTGRQLALTGIVLCLVFLITGVTVAGYTYATEVPEGHRRVAFQDLRPDEIEQRSGEAIPAEILALDGQKVFIKGYMRPSSQKLLLDSFLLVRDNNECCFGDSLPAYYDRVQVQLQGKLTADYSLGVFRMAGLLHVHPDNVNRGSQFPVFTLEADYLR